MTVKKQIWDQVDNQVGDQAWEQVDNQVQEDLA